MQKLPLEGIRVIDFSQVRMGPQITQWLGVMGAEVIKIETRAVGGPPRIWTIPEGEEPRLPPQAIYFADLNYSKKGITLNMKEPRAVELIKELSKISDIVVENFGGPVMDRWGIGYADLKKLKPDIICYSGSGFGRTGPFREHPVYAPVAEAYSGSSFTNGYIGGEPVSVGIGGWTDSVAGQQGLFSILIALYYRSKTGEGQYIDLSMTEARIASAPEPVLDYVINGRVRGRMGNRDDFMAPHGCYRCSGDDKWVAIAVSNDEEWVAFCNAIGNPEWTKREEFSDTPGRWENQDELDRRISEWTISHDHYEVMQILQAAGVMAGATLDLGEVANDPHLRERGILVDMEHPKMGKATLASLPWKLSDIPKGNYQFPPLLGEHNDYVFGELLGLSKEEIKRLEEEKVIY
ncbi:CaiB/BaiF CoA transferase family protein [Chloroflexota bacterium]